jgi:hypothetical protein
MPGIATDAGDTDVPTGSISGVPWHKVISYYSHMCSDVPDDSPFDLNMSFF